MQVLAFDIPCHIMHDITLHGIFCHCDILCMKSCQFYYIITLLICSAVDVMKYWASKGCECFSEGCPYNNTTPHKETDRQIKRQTIRKPYNREKRVQEVDRDGELWRERGRKAKEESVLEKEGDTG